MIDYLMYNRVNEQKCYFTGKILTFGKEYRHFEIVLNGNYERCGLR